jgi:hypothetical protein
MPNRSAVTGLAWRQRAKDWCILPLCQPSYAPVSWRKEKLRLSLGRVADDGGGSRFMPQSGMSDDNATYPYTLTISPSERLAGHFDWGSADTASSSNDQIGPIPPNDPPEKAGKRRLSTSSTMTVNRNAASNLDGRPGRARPFSRHARSSQALRSNGG